jgi:integrase
LPTSWDLIGLGNVYAFFGTARIGSWFTSYRSWRDMVGTPLAMQPKLMRDADIRVWQVFQNAASVAGVGKLSTHTMRHSYRSWLDAVGTPIAVQQKLMRHADIRTTMNVYGDVVTDEMREAHQQSCRFGVSENRLA